MQQKFLNITDVELDRQSAFFGELDCNIAAVEREYGIVATHLDGQLKLSGPDEYSVGHAYKVFDYLRQLLKVSDAITEQNIRYAISMVNEGDETELVKLATDCICVTSKGRPINAKTVGQRRYVDAIGTNTIVLGIGPAGTGKTFLAVAMAVTALRQKKCGRIVLTRPAVEAGERLGFLPGDLQSKIDPYLRPLYDALYEMIGFESTAKYQEKNIIEIAPLAYMRGRTLDDAFIILDEAQNTTPEQMKMFLTRLGHNSKMVITGDVTQIDLPGSTFSGLVQASRILRGIEDIVIHNFTEKDVVRHSLVQKIIVAYDKYDKSRVNAYGAKKYHVRNGQGGQ